MSAGGNDGTGQLPHAPVSVPKAELTRRSGALSWMRGGYEALIYYGGLLLFALMCLIWSLAALFLAGVLPESIGIRVGRRAIQVGFRSYLWVLQRSGIVRCDLKELDSLNAETGLVLIANHPSLIDVVLIVSRLPNAVCLIKATLWDQLLFGGSVRLADYIRNSSRTGLVLKAVREVQAGGQLLIFPEGTRTVGARLLPFRGGVALIAKRARSPVQTLFIEINHPFLGKGRSLFAKPAFPLVFKARLGRRFEPSADAHGLVTQLEQYYQRRIFEGERE